MARVLVLTIAIANGAVAILEALFAVYVSYPLGGGSRMFGSVTSALGVGTILGAMLVGRFAERQSRPRIINAGFLVQAVSVFVLGVWAMPVTTLAASVGLGAGAALVFLSAQTFALEEIPPEDAGPGNEHSHVSFCRCSARCVWQQRIAGELAGIAQPLLYRCHGRGPDRNRCTFLDSKRTRRSSQERERFGRELSPVAGVAKYLSL